MKAALFKEILDNNTSGASTLYKQTLELFISNEFYHGQRRALEAVRKLRKSFPAMAVFAYLEERLRESSEAVDATARRLRDDARQQIDSIARTIRRYWRKKRRIITISHSSVVESIITRNKNRVSSVLVSVSSPMNEGEGLALKLARQGIPIMLCADANLPGMIQSDDLVLLGADCVAESFIVNKTGSYALALAAREKKARCLVVAESFKRVSKNYFRFTQTRKPPNEIATARAKNITVHNAYFETVPMSLIDRVISG